MSIVTLVQAKAQGRITESAEDDLIQGYLDAAEQQAARYLNRSVYPDATTLAAAMTAAPVTLTAANVVWMTAQTAYQLADVPDESVPDQQYAYTGLSFPLPDDVPGAIFLAAQAAWKSALEQFYMDMHAVAIFPVFQQAVILLVQGWYANRENMTFEASAAGELPEGFRMLLFPYRARLGV